MSEEDGFEDYVETTVDPGYSLILATTFFCILTNIMLPCFVSLGRRYQKRLVDATEAMEDENVDFDCQGQETAYDTQIEQKKDEAPEAEVLLLQSCPPDGDWLSLHSCGSLSAPCFPPIPKYGQDSVGSNINQSRHSTLSATSNTASAVSNIVLNALTEYPIARARHGRTYRGVDEWYRHRQHYQESLATSVRMMDTANNGGRGTTATPPSIIGTECVVTDLNIPGVDLPGGEGANERIVNSQKESSIVNDIDVDTSGSVHDDNSRRSSEREHDDDVGMCCGENAWWRPTSISLVWGDFLDLIDWDMESRRLWKLAIPFTITAVIEGLFDLVTIGLISHYIGTEAVSAFAVVDIVVGLSSELVVGIAFSITVLCPHAIGARNYRLAGQYVQLSAIFYTLSMIPFIVLWSLTMDSVILWFGFNERTAQMGQDFAVLYVFQEWLSGLQECYMLFLDCIDRERWTAFVSFLEALLAVLIILFNVLTRETTLVEVGFILIGVQISVLVIDVTFTFKRGWVQKYTKGIIGNIALKNRAAIKTLMRTALPLCIGTLVENGEWEILTLFAGHLGPAEVAAWGILGTLWDTIEATSDAVADAGEIRCAYHLGAGRPVNARIAAYKCILLGLVFSSFVTSVLFILGEDLATWLTTDPTLQRMIIEVIPLIGIGNILLTAGTVSWSLVGSQGRYRLSTLVASVTSWGVTMPLGAFFTYALNLNLQGLTAATVMGFSLAATALTYILIMSDWERLSKGLAELNVGERNSSDSDSSSSSLNSSSPSSTPASSR